MNEAARTERIGPTTRVGRTCSGVNCDRARDDRAQRVAPRPADLVQTIVRRRSR